MISRLLIVEDSRVFAAIIKRKFQDRFDFEMDFAASFKDVKDLIEHQKRTYDLALLDINLPDAPNGEVIDYALARKIPAIVLSGEFDQQVRKRFYMKYIVDYQVKNSPRDLDVVANVIDRFVRNSQYRILVVDDSRTARGLETMLLECQNYKVYQADDGTTALELFESGERFDLMITDFNMPEMDGHTLTAKLRETYGKDTLAIIGVSAEGEDTITAKFLKLGANDFIRKPFSIEEFHCRISQNIDILEMIGQIRDASNRDYLTKLYNRRFFFDHCIPCYHQTCEKEQPIAAAIMDIDFFKKVNDTYGHLAGDYVLKEVACILEATFESEHFTVARFGGEEFVVCLLNTTPQTAVDMLEAFRKLVSETKFEFESQTIPVTLSVGLVTKPHNSLDDMIKYADELLYQAKQRGRNRVISDIDTKKSS